MKVKIIFNIAIVILVLAVIYIISKNVGRLGHDYHFEGYDSRKINLLGEYQPFYGYTIVAMLDPSLAAIAERVEQFLRSSSLSASYSPLPASSYHMTIFSIYQCGSRMIPPVERWVNGTGATISNKFWLPDEVLQKQNDKAMCIIDKYLNKPLQIKYTSLLIHKRAVKFSLEVDEESMHRIRNARKEFAKIYEDSDLLMEPINEKLHMQLAYVYAPVVTPNMDEWNQLNEFVRMFNGERFTLSSVYLFDSMANYIPYRRRVEMEC